MFKISKRTINLKTLCNVGIYYVTDLVHVEEGPFMTLIELRESMAIDQISWNITEFLVQ